MTVMKYCTTGTLASGGQANGKNGCINEALTDPTLFTTIDKTNNTIWRRIKHFSGYLIAE
jgi:hypothetical protein